MSEHVFDKEAWAKQTIFWQLGNIGSEVGRALTAKKQGKEQRSMSAFYRGMDLINYTVQVWVQEDRSPRELLIAREQFALSILTEDVDETLEKYFMDFAMAERLNR